MSQLPAPTAQRLRRPSWKDPRLAVGVVLVLASVALGSRVVAAADDTVPVYAAAGALVPGDPLQESRLTVVQARVDGALDRYLTADADLPDGAVLLRPVGPGELVPRSAVGDAERLDRRPVGVPLEGPVPAGLVKGSLVDVWVSEPDPERAGAFTEPEQLAGSAEVAEVTEAGGAFAAGGTTTVQVLLPEDQLRRALRALAADAELALVLVPGSTPSRG
ncbi:MAG: SAF domain-containing protein [Actinomycetota bacterium]